MRFRREWKTDNLPVSSVAGNYRDNIIEMFDKTKFNKRIKYLTIGVMLLQRLYKSSLFPIAAVKTHVVYTAVYAGYYIVRRRRIIMRSTTRTAAAHYLL